MKKFSAFITVLALLMVVGAGVFLVTWDIPAPMSSVEKVIPDDRFPR
nr:hypothetical protein [Roseovarius pacificus]